MRFSQLKKQAHSLFHEAAWLSEIKTAKEYAMALKLMDELIEDYDFNRGLIVILSASIERWEDESIIFKGFNEAVARMDPGISLLRLLMDQHKLGVADFPEIGSKSLVSRILNSERRLTVDHIHALSERFGISPSLFFEIKSTGRQKKF